MGLTAGQLRSRRTAPAIATRETQRLQHCPYCGRIQLVLWLFRRPTRNEATDPSRSSAAALVVGDPALLQSERRSQMEGFQGEGGLEPGAAGEFPGSGKSCGPHYSAAHVCQPFTPVRRSGPAIVKFIADHAQGLASRRSHFVITDGR